MIIAGIDEAGYGPLLGPLVVGCCAFELDEVEPLDLEAPIPDLPCVWKRLRRHVSRNRTKDGRRLHINDSKLVYSPSAGLKELERSVLSLIAASGELCNELNEVIARLAPHALDDLDGYSWYQPGVDEKFPLEQDSLPLRLFAKSLKQEMDRTRTRCAYMGARLVFERQLNRMIDATRNKASALFSTAAVHLNTLLTQFSERDLYIMCDRQGGREHYGSLLRLMFEDWSLEILSESDGRSAYRLHRGDRTVRLVFTEKAEAQCLPVAVASMISKYLREAMMHRFNCFWRGHLPDLAPTAGYYGDGVRFLGDIELKRQELGIADEELIRSR